MTIWQALILGIVEGLTEFLPVSSTGHLTVTEKIMGLPIDDPHITAYTAVIQVGAIAAVVVYFRADLARLITGFLRGLRGAPERKELEFRMAVYVIVGSLPIGVAGLLGKSLIEGPLRSLWVVGGALIGWSGVMLAAERVASQARHENETTLSDALVIGLVQCVSLVPGVSRSGATISAGLFRGLDRVAATRLSFFLSIPALVAAGAYELRDALGGGPGVGPTVVGTAVSFVVAYASVAWLLRFVAHHTLLGFVGYRIAAGLVVLAAVSTGILTAT